MGEKTKTQSERPAETTFFDRLAEACGTEEVAEIARKTGLSYNTIKSYRSGRSPACPQLTAIHRRTGASVDYLLFGRLPEPAPLPWVTGPLAEWAIIGLNHYHVDGVRHLFVSMGRKRRYIKAEGPDERAVFADLARQAREAAGADREVPGRARRGQRRQTGRRA